MEPLSAAAVRPSPGPPPVAIVDLLDRALACGVVVTGEVILSIADVDLVRVSLQALLSSVYAEQPAEPDGSR